MVYILFYLGIYPIFFFLGLSYGISSMNLQTHVLIQTHGSSSFIKFVAWLKDCNRVIVSLIGFKYYFSTNLLVCFQEACKSDLLFFSYWVSIGKLTQKKEFEANNKRPHNPLSITLVRVRLLVSLIIVRNSIWSSELIREIIWGSAQKQPTC